MRAKILAGCLLALLTLRLLLPSGGERQGRALPGLTAEDSETSLAQRAWPEHAEDASGQPTERAYPPSPDEEGGEDDFAEALSNPLPDGDGHIERYAEALFRQLDRNGDGLLDAEEMTTALRTALDHWDADEDGVIDPREFLAYFRARVALFRAGAVAAAPATNFPGADRLPPWLNEMDTDRDGQVALYEWRATGRSVEEFRRLDRNGDGFLTPREAATAAQQAAPSTLAPAPSTRPSDTPPTSASSLVAARGSGGTQGGGLYNQTTGGYISTPSAKGTTATAPDRIEQQHVAAAAAPPRAAPAPARAAARPTPAPRQPVATLASPINNGTSPYWTLREQQNELRLQEGPAKILFLGDSITDLLETGAGQPVWDTFFAPLGAADFAIGGLATSQVLWQVESGEVALAAPQVVVLMIGTNNLGGGQTPGDTAAGIAKIVDEIHTQLPKTRILLLGLLPRGESPDEPLRAKVAQVNALIANLQGNGVTFLDIGADFLLPNGTISPAVMPDFLHPSLLGYQIYTIAIWETLMALLAAG